MLFERYIAGHSREAGMMKSMPLPDAPSLMMGMTGPLMGLVSGAVIGGFALIALKLMKPR
jgi:hypothetical protein